MFCNKCGTELADGSLFCGKCGRALAAPLPHASTLGAVATPKAAPSNTNIGTIVFSGFAILSLFVSFAKGLVPISLAEAALWAGLAWYWHKKGSTKFKRILA
jgi:hypothetical protein